MPLDVSPPRPRDIGNAPSRSSRSSQQAVDLLTQKFPTQSGDTAGLLATGIPFVGRMGVGSAIVVAAVAVGAVTVLPTLMGAFASRLKPKNPKTVAPSNAFERWAQRITSRPRTAAIAGTAILLVLAAPVLGLRLGMPDDAAAKIAARLPIFIALVIGLSIVLLMAVFRSLWVPLVSAAFNLLSIAAAYGVVVAVFQEGVGVPIVSFVPLFMFAILFGLSMDYNVFLQSRIREEYMRGESPQESVIKALSRVGRIILAAGAIMTSVFLGFVSDPDVVVQTIGLGLAVAILIDVLVVRMIVAPAVMTLLGDRAWALPKWLDRALPRIALEGEPTPA